MFERMNEHHLHCSKFRKRVSSVETVNIDVDMNNLPEYVHDVFLDAKESCCFDYELVNIQHFKMVDDNGKVDTEFWDLAFYETSIRDWLYFVKITVQPWNPTPVHKDYITVPMYTMEKILSKVEEIRNGNL
jgi:hypothetical protein